MIRTVQFVLNGKKTEVTVDASRTLLEVLRTDLALTGTKCGCEKGECGACTVIINGRAVNACMYPVMKLQGAEIQTVEGLQEGGRLHPVQRAFLETGAIQCGFCTPGMLMSAKALLDENPSPGREAIISGMGGNICRCTGYVKIIEAIELAAAYLRGEEPEPADYRSMETTSLIRPGAGDEGKAEKPEGRYFGKRMPDLDGVAKATGALLFANDRKAEDMLYGAVVWSSRTSADILSVDYSAAKALPGVCGIVTATDVPGRNLFSAFVAEQPVFCDKEVNFLGDMIALVAADTEENARAAAALVKVEYRDKPGCYSIGQGVADKDNPKRIIRTLLREAGDVETAKAEPCTRLSAEFKMERVDHAAIEPVAALALWRGDAGIKIVSCTQSPFEIVNMLTTVLDQPKEKIHVTAAPIGGGFGKKCDSCLEAAAAVAATVLRKSVMIRLNREEDLRATTKRHAFETSCEIGVKDDGALLYINSTLRSDAGPYTQLSHSVLEQAMLFSGGPYEIPNIHLDGQCIRTNNASGGAFRGFGINQGAIGIESMLDEAARKLNMDPFEIRRRNALRPGAVTVGGEILHSSVGILATIDECEKAVKREYKKYSKLYPKGDKVLGVGIACGYKNVGSGKGLLDDGGCIFTMLPNGKIEMRLSGADMGQGFRTAMLQIACEKLNRKPEDITLISSDTELTLPHRQATAQRQTLCAGSAVVICAGMLLKKLEEEHWEPGKSCTASYYHVVGKTHSLDDSEARTKHPETYRNYAAYAYLTQAAFIELDKSTGQVKVLKVISCNDCGRAINPQIIEGQIQGSCSMGIGYALTESYPMEEGVPKVMNYGQLGVPTIDQTPEYEVVIIEDPAPEGPFGAKGVSEVATVPMTPAVMNALRDASGVRFYHVPIKPDDILAAMKARA